MNFTKKIKRNYSLPVTILIIILVAALVIGASFLVFTFGYWLITLILAGFFNFILPFSWWYSFGAWLIGLIVGIFIFGGLNFKINRE